MKELYKVYRPKRFRDVIGQPEAVKTLEVAIKTKKVDHAYLFSGESGTGKTTLARILAKELNCSGMDLHEMNSASFRGIETIRQVQARVGTSPTKGDARVWIIDECHRLTGEAQDAVLKILEDTPSHVYFFLCTTTPQKLIKAIRTRCTPIQTKPLKPKDMGKLLFGICEKGNYNVPDEVVERIIEHSEGSPRMALVFLNQVVRLESEEDQLNCIFRTEDKKVAYDICKLFYKPKIRYSDVRPLLDSIQEDPETIRRIVLATFTKVMLGTRTNLYPRALVVIEAFRDHWYDCGKAGLVAACYEVLAAK